MITDGFTYVAALIALAGILVGLEKRTKWKFFEYIPPIVLLYLLAMIFCTMQIWDLKATKPAYSVLKNNLLYAMVFMMLLRCDIRKVLKLGPRLIGGLLTASLTIGIAFIVMYAIMHTALGAGAWKAMAALCGSWIGGSGNMIAVQAALNVDEVNMGYALVVDSIDYSIWVMFLLWAINFAVKFNHWTKSNTSVLDEVSRKLEADQKANTSEISFPGLFFLLGLSLIISTVGQHFGSMINTALPYLDKSTWTILFITVLGPVCAMTPLGRIGGSTMLSNILLYSIVALLASRASFLELENAPIWIISGFMILVIHGLLLTLAAKIFKLDLFTCGVASLANIGGTASAPILAGVYSQALVPVGVLMALMGYIIGTGGALIVGQIMSSFG